jgi:hypothetical protein
VKVAICGTGYDARNPRALNRLVAAGAQLVVLSPDILKALRTALEQVLDEDAAKSEQFKRCARELARLPRRAAPLVLDRGRPHRDVCVRTHHRPIAKPLIGRQAVCLVDHLGHSRRYRDVRCRRAKRAFAEKLCQLSTRRQHHSIRSLGPMKNRTVMQQPSA